MIFNAAKELGQLSKLKVGPGLVLWQLYPEGLVFTTMMHFNQGRVCMTSGVLSGLAGAHGARGGEGSEPQTVCGDRAGSGHH